MIDVVGPMFVGVLFFMLLLGVIIVIECFIGRK